MPDEEKLPGPLAAEKSSDEAPAGHPEPDAAEVESARLLANQAREPLRADGFDDEAVRRLADAFVALDLGDDVDVFVRWARERGRAQLRTSETRRPRS